ncbi:protein kinase C-binding protein 1-like [Pollicipes pollicipes]|uniref:protein kinase C-binding protein 1-like n=1 Tax=Pollicipes pollicipes TaxID=41117 RepID=UPI00188495F6|nr:protein kinase C-binding protein 1-like [Pollicipes pollicipes]
MRTGLERAISELAQAGGPQSAIANLRLQVERLQWRHQMELSEQRKVTDTMLAELRNSMEIEQKKALNKLTASFAAERSEWSRQTEQKVGETKKKQWCATCGREAIFYCCWNTSYCDFPCQEAQWPKHMLTCANQQSSQQASSPAAGAGDGDGGGDGAQEAQSA